MKTEIIAAAPIQYFPLAQLYVSDLNPRQDADPEGIDLLADSLAMIGLIQPIAGFRDEAGKVGVVAGGRRWRAIRLGLDKRGVQARTGRDFTFRQRLAGAAGNTDMKGNAHRPSWIDSGKR